MPRFDLTPATSNCELANWTLRRVSDNIDMAATYATEGYFCTESSINLIIKCLTCIDNLAQRTTMHDDFKDYAEYYLDGQITYGGSTHTIATDYKFWLRFYD